MALKETDPKSGFFTFIHHQEPVEFSDDITKRIEFIKYTKPGNEVAIRLDCITYIKNPPIWFRTYMEARRVHMEANRVYTEANRVYKEANRVYTVIYSTNRANMIKLALQLNPTAPWDGEALVFPK